MSAFSDLPRIYSLIVIISVYIRWANIAVSTGFQPTYKELKQLPANEDAIKALGFQPTYKELKHFLQVTFDDKFFVFSLPIRN